MRKQKGIKNLCRHNGIYYYRWLSLIYRLNVLKETFEKFRLSFPCKGILLELLKIPAFIEMINTIKNHFSEVTIICFSDPT